MFCRNIFYIPQEHIPDTFIIYILFSSRSLNTKKITVNTKTLINMIFFSSVCQTFIECFPLAFYYTSHMYISDLATVSRSQFIIYTQSSVYIIYKRCNVPSNEYNLLTKHIDSLQMTLFKQEAVPI